MNSYGWAMGPTYRAGVSRRDALKGNCGCRRGSDVADRHGCCAEQAVRGPDRRASAHRRRLGRGVVRAKGARPDGQERNRLGNFFERRLRGSTLFGNRIRTCLRSEVERHAAKIVSDNPKSFGFFAAIPFPDPEGAL